MLVADHIVINSKGAVQLSLLPIDIGQGVEDDHFRLVIYGSRRFLDNAFCPVYISFCLEDPCQRKV